MAPRRLLVVLACAALIPACRRDAPPVATSAPPVAASAPPAATPRPAEPRVITLVAGGDISFGRLVGRMLLHDPSTDFFKAVRPWLDAADVRFANLEGPLADLHGEVQKPDQPLVFAGPPAGAQALARAGFTVVATANNHAWDYGEPALLETLALLDAAGILHAGTGRSREEAQRAAVVDVGGFKLAVLAVTDIWNQGPLDKHPADAFVARAEESTLGDSVRALRTYDAVVVSYHGGVEYTDTPIPRTRRIFHAAIDAGADAVLGHHPHVVQGVEWYRGRPLLYSLGNFLMRMHRDHAWTELGYLARLTLEKDKPPKVSACPFRIYGVEVLPLAGDRARATYERRFFDHLAAISEPLGATGIGEPGADGCAPLFPAAPDG